MVIAIIAILAAILFPVFAKAREKARQTKCTSNLRQIVLGALMYAQENGEILPVASNFWNAVGVPQALFVCPTKKTQQNGYGYNTCLSGVSLGDVDPNSTVEFPVVADSAVANNIIGLSQDFEYRHDKKVVVGYLDGHVSVTGDMVVPYPAPQSNLNCWLRADKAGAGNTYAWYSLIGGYVAGDCRGSNYVVNSSFGTLPGVNGGGGWYCYDGLGISSGGYNKTIVCVFKPSTVASGHLFSTTYVPYYNYWYWQGDGPELFLSGGKVGTAGCQTANYYCSKVSTTAVSNSITANVPHFAAVSYSSSGISLYVDNQNNDTPFVDSTINATVGAWTFLLNTSAIIGGQQYVGSTGPLTGTATPVAADPYQGVVGEFLIYNKTLGPNDIAKVKKYCNYKYGLGLVTP